jgi:hypothetical protein
VRRLALLFPIFLAACGGAPDGDVGAVTLEQERLKFRDELTILTYQSQCPPVHPVVLDRVAQEIEVRKTALHERIKASNLKTELDASHREMDRQGRYSNESECTGTAFPSSDHEAVINYRSVFSEEKRKLLSLETHFQILSRKING